MSEETGCEASGAEFMADAVIRFLDGHIQVTGNLTALTVLKNVRKEVEDLKNHAAHGRIKEILGAHRR